MSASPLHESGVFVTTTGERPSFLYRRSGVWTVRIVTLAVLLGSWELYARHQSRALNAPPSAIGQAFWNLMQHSDLYSALWSSMEALLLGFLLSFAIGVPIGILMGRWKSVEWVLDPYVSFFYGLPHVVFIPAMVVWFGFELKFRLLYVLVSAIWPFIINSMAGVRAIDSELLMTAKAFCANERQTQRTVVIPAIVPFVVAAIRQSLALCWVAAVVSEILSTQTGIGGMLTHFGTEFRTDYMYVPVIIISLIAVAIQGIAGKLQGRLAPWSDQGAAGAGGRQI
jgi:ABC-type nitrate/sulfonate/bicarbonate transport system permease component